MKNVIREGLIGLSIKVIKAKNKSNEGIEGKIIDETKHTIKIKQKNKEKMLMKKNITLEIPDKNVRVKGDLLIGRPEERIKKKLR